MLTNEELEALQEKYCRFCGTQRCHGMFDEVCREGCEHYQKANGTYEGHPEIRFAAVKEPITVWFITVFEKVEKDKFGPDFGSSRCWGFYSDRDVAIRAVRENWTDMRECLYDYAVVEGYDEGIAHDHDPAEAQWFMWNEEAQEYQMIDRPEAVVGFGSWAIG